MKYLISIVYLVLATSIATAQSEDQTPLALEGAYLLTQTNDIQRVLAFSRGGTVSLVGAGEQHRGYTSGLGAWEQTGPNQIVARLVDFNFDRDSGAPTGASLTVYTLEFDGLEQGHFQKVSGTFSGEQFELGQNPLNPTKDPIRTFGREITGQRITAQ